VRAARLEDGVRRALARYGSTLAGVAVVLLLAGSVVLVGVAADVLRWQRQLERGDTVFAAGGPLTRVAWEPDTLLPVGISQAVLDVQDDLDYRRALRRYWRSEPRAPLREFADVTRRAGAERMVARVSESDVEPARRAQLSVLRGGLLLEEARNSPIQREVFVRRAIAEFKRAAELDPHSEIALYDLELSLRVLRRSGSSDGEGGTSRSPLPAPASGAATSGGGF